MPFYVPPRGPSNATIMIVGEGPGKDEKTGPFQGYSGQGMSRMLAEAGIIEAECFITNVLRFQPPGNDENFYITIKKGLGQKNKWLNLNGRWHSEVGLDHRQHLYDEVRAVQPYVILAFGDLALWALTGENGIIKWRGSVLPTAGFVGYDCKVVPAIHPAAVMRVWSYRPVVVEDCRRVKKEAETKELIQQEHNYIIRPSFEAVKSWFKSTLAFVTASPKSIHISCDLETRTKQIACIGFGLNTIDAICIPLMCLERPEGYWSFEEELEIIKWVQQLMLHPNVRISGQNFMYDAQYFAKQLGFLPVVWWDTMNMQHVFFPDLPGILKPKSLGFLATMYCEHPVYWKDEGKNWDPKVGEDQLWEYNCKDDTNTWEIAERQKDIPAQLGVEYPAKFQMRLWRPLVKMMLRGLAQDKEKRKRVAAELQVYQDELKAYLDFVIGHPFNPSGSSPQGKQFFYDDLRIKAVYKKNSKGKWSRTLDDAAMEVVAQREPLVRPLISAIQNYRSAGVFRATFAESELDTDGRMRCSWNLAVAKTFRLSSSEDAFDSGGNLQNQPNAAQSAIARIVQQHGEVTIKQLAELLNQPIGKTMDDVDDGVEKGYLWTKTA